MSVNNRPDDAPSVVCDLCVLAALIFVLGMGLFYLRLLVDYSVPDRYLIVVAIPVFVAAGCLCVRWSASIENPAVRLVGTAATVYTLVLVTMIAYRGLSVLAQ